MVNFLCMNKTKALITPDRLAQALGAATNETRLAPIVIFNFLNQPVPKSIGILTATKDSFFGAHATRFGDELTVLSNLGLGSPSLAFYFEMALHYGAQKFILLGQAGAIVFEEASMRDGGNTVEPGHVVFPTAALAAPSLIAQYLDLPDDNRRIERPQNSGELDGLVSRNTNVVAIETVWSTGALFCETPARLAQAHAQGAQLVDMETATLFTLGNCFKVPTVAGLLVTDVLKPGAHPTWQPHIRETVEARRILLQNTCAALLRSTAQLR